MLITGQYNYDVAIQLIVIGSQFENFILFKDALINNQKLVDTYNQIYIKYQHEADDLYRSEKSKFIKKVLSS
jgi:GrpB-like predicted nucleotidyltransferase (UPF0157 family)